MEFDEKLEVYSHPTFGTITYNEIWDSLEELSEWVFNVHHNHSYFDTYHNSIITYLAMLHTKPKGCGWPFCKKVIMHIIFYDFMLYRGGSLEILFIIYRFHPKLVVRKLNDIRKTTEPCSRLHYFVSSVVSQPQIEDYHTRRITYRKMASMLGFDVKSPMIAFHLSDTSISGPKFDAVMDVYRSYPNLASSLPSKLQCEAFISHYYYVCNDCLACPEETYWDEIGWVNNASRGCQRCIVKYNALAKYNIYNAMKIKYTLYDMLHHTLITTN